MLFNIIGASLCTSLVNPFLCLSAVLREAKADSCWVWHSFWAWPHSHSPYLPDNLQRRFWRGVNGEKTTTAPHGVWGGRDPKVLAKEEAAQSHHEMFRQASDLRAPRRRRIQRHPGRFPQSMWHKNCENTVSSPLETMEKNHVLQGQIRAEHKDATRQMNMKTCCNHFQAQKQVWFTSAPAPFSSISPSGSSAILTPLPWDRRHLLEYHNWKHLGGHEGSHSHFWDKETEAKKGEGTYLASYRSAKAEPASDLQPWVAVSYTKHEKVISLMLNDNTGSTWVD